MLLCCLCVDNVRVCVCVCAMPRSTGSSTVHDPGRFGHPTKPRRERGIVIFIVYEQTSTSSSRRWDRSHGRFRSSQTFPIPTRKIKPNETCSVRICLPPLRIQLFATAGQKEADGQVSVDVSSLSVPSFRAKREINSRSSYCFLLPPPPKRTVLPPCVGSLRASFPISFR